MVHLYETRAAGLRFAVEAKDGYDAAQEILKLVRKVRRSLPTGVSLCGSDGNIVDAIVRV